MRKTLALVMIILSLSATAMGRNMFTHDIENSDFVPQPYLIAPTTETVDLTGKEMLEFKWSPHEGRRIMREYYDFRLYKGYDMLEGTLLVKERVDPGAQQISVKSDLFSDGQIYTWSLRQVYDGIRKSRRSTASFKVIKK